MAWNIPLTKMGGGEGRGRGEGGVEALIGKSNFASVGLCTVYV